MRHSKEGGRRARCAGACEIEQLLRAGLTTAAEHQALVAGQLAKNRGLIRCHTFRKQVRVLCETALRGAVFVMWLLIPIAHVERDSNPDLQSVDIICFIAVHVAPCGGRAVHVLYTLRWAKFVDSLCNCARATAPAVIYEYNR